MKMQKGYLLLLGVLAILLASCAPQPTAPGAGPATTPEAKETEEAEEHVAQPALGAKEYEVKTGPDGTKYIVDPGDIVGGGPPKDGIPSIDDPRYVSVAEADEWIQDNELVLTIVYKGVTRVYPLQIMVWHEIVNDVIAGDPILITY